MPLSVTDACPAPFAWTTPAASPSRVVAAAALAAVVVVAVVAVAVVSEDVVVVAEVVASAVEEVVVVVAAAVAVVASAPVLTARLLPSLVLRSLSIKRKLMRNSCGLRASGGFSNEWAFVGCRFNTS